jgi:hypothetical protein
MMGVEDQHELTAVKASAPCWLELRWGDGREARIDLTRTLEGKAFEALRDPAVFTAVNLGDWGHSLVWPGDIEIGADSLWLDSLSAWGREDTRSFLEWRLRNGFSATAAAEALGISRASVIRYSTEATVPRSIQLACKGWDALKAA